MKATDYVDRNVLERMRHFDKEQYNEIMRALDFSKKEPGTKVALALFRDSLVFREMANATVLSMRMEIESLKTRVEKLEDANLGDTKDEN